jgi:hypothetical protein
VARNTSSGQANPRANQIRKSSQQAGAVNGSTQAIVGGVSAPS